MPKWYNRIRTFREYSVRIIKCWNKESKKNLKNKNFKWFQRIYIIKQYLILGFIKFKKKKILPLYLSVETCNIWYWYTWSFSLKINITEKK